MDLDLDSILPLGKQSKRKFGTVFLIQSKDHTQTFVLKNSRKDAISATALQLIKNEFLYSFDHPSLPKVLSFSEDEQSISLLLAHKRGTNLEDFWSALKKNERLPFIKRLTIQLLEVLNIIHEKNFIHCDIKPSNILIEGTQEQFTVHIIDFGMAIDQKNRDYNRKLLFPLGFAAPELILNRLHLVAPQTDYFAVGILLYRLWMGKLPLTHENPSVYTNLQLVHPIPEERDFPIGMNDLIARLCVKPKFPTAPNRMPQEMVDQHLQEAIKGRFENINQIIEAVQKMEEKRKWKFF